MLILPFIPFSGKAWAFSLCSLAIGHHCIYIYILYIFRATPLFVSHLAMAWYFYMTTAALFNERASVAL
jgi:hypothetical protein